MAKDPFVVSKSMKQIHSKDTSIEIQLRKALWHKGYRYRKNYAALPGSPDIVLTKYKIAIFCDSEFFHGKDWEILNCVWKKETILISGLKKFSEIVTAIGKMIKSCCFLATLYCIFGEMIFPNIQVNVCKPLKKLYGNAARNPYIIFINNSLLIISKVSSCHSKICYQPVPAWTNILYFQHRN